MPRNLENKTDLAYDVSGEKGRFKQGNDVVIKKKKKFIFFIDF